MDPADRHSRSPGRQNASCRTGPAAILAGVTIGTSLLVIAAGAILRYAVTATVAGVDLQTVGSILLVVGVVGLVIGLWLEISGRERDRAQSGPS